MLLSELLEARLTPDMLPLTGKVQRASDTAEFAAVRLGSVENTPFADEERSFWELQDRIARSLARIPQKSQLAEDIRYTLAHWTGLLRFLDNGTLELDTNPVENQIRPIALTRKNALFAGNEAENRAMLTSLIATCKMSGANPVDYIAATQRHPHGQSERPHRGSDAMALHATVKPRRIGQRRRAYR
jgi:Transposase IS66 family/Domain of unknown function (DUF1993)